MFILLQNLHEEWSVQSFSIEHVSVGPAADEIFSERLLSLTSERSQSGVRSLQEHDLSHRLGLAIW